MGMQTDVLATKPLTATGNFKTQGDGDIPRTRVKTIYAVNGASAGSVVIREGGASGNIIATVNTAANTTAGYTIIPAMKGADWYDKSDAQIDYFDTAYYYDVNVGSWNKPYTLTK